MLYCSKIILKKMGYVQMVDSEVFSNKKRYFIYGAGDVAREVLYCLREEPFNLRIEALIVSDTNIGSGKQVDGIPVISCSDLEFSDDMQVIVAVLEKYKDEICARLDRIGIKNPVLMTFESDLWCEERGRAYALYRQKREKTPYILLQDGQVQLPRGNSGRKSLIIYVAKSHMDKPLKNNVENFEWEKDIQVGAACAKT